MHGPRCGAFLAPVPFVPSDRAVGRPDAASLIAARRTTQVVKPLAAATGAASKRRAKNPLPRIDDINKAIITELQKDGRRSYTAIAEKVRLSEAAVRQRVQRLIDDGVMQIVAVTDPIRLGFKRMAMIAMRADGDVDQSPTRSVEGPRGRLRRASPGGSYDLLCEVVCEDDDHLIDVLNKTIRSLPGVRETETFMYLRLHKESYTWGVPSADTRTTAASCSRMECPCALRRSCIPSPALRPSADEFIDIVRGEGAAVFDAAGKRYVDGMASLWYCQVGHGRTEIADAVSQ